ncbi:4Fe-4S dicluster domain-containing protein [Eggerthellaceae bacterium zg-887]|uniref:4Fe-4S dicluster domain-containing protein n=1 Tax=Xiamenia xianingshaonis TaxID=2682776 RepID=UPI00140CA3BD|nr:4Fe-4S dicluster domain-containing protein [Xiamenia xianingshaonis]NHM15403.1 4Fe-4S dicluster domain-containing protein [Xiamenia xianingshaonis]
MAYGFLIDLKKCVGCHGCSVACKAANGTPVGVTRSKVLREFEGTYPNTKRVIRPILCMLCSKPSCVEACPTGASFVNDEGIVQINKQECIGCQTCMSACPYGARYYVENDDGYFGAELNDYEELAYDANGMVSGTVDKCDFCIGHSEDGKPDPVCVKACMTEARVFGDLAEIQALAQKRGGEVWMPDAGTEPNVYYLPA